MTKKITQFIYTAIGLLVLMVISACGETKSDRALSGAGLGAGAGAVGSALVGGDTVTGAVIGGAVGATAGGLTNEDDINLGKPIWRH